MSKKAVRWISLIIAVVFIFGTVGTILFELAYAETTQQKINKAEASKKDAQQKLNDANTKKVKTLAEKERLEKEAGELQVKIEALDKTIAETKADLAVEEEKLAVATEKANEKYDVFQERFRVMCEQGDVSYIEMLLSAKSFSDFVDKAEIMKEISRYDKAVFDEMDEARQQIEKSRDEIVKLKETQESSAKDLASQKSALVQKQQEQANYIKELEKDTAAYQRIIDEADAAMASLRASVSGSLSKTSGGKTYVGGEFTWPTPSCHYITSHFSPRRKNPVTGVYKRHTGTDIGASYGAAIVAANSGTVTLAGWNSGYGNCVIIDHGGGKATLYAHMSAYSVSAGQTVSKGQRIGSVGSTGNSTGPHLHFEVLINGTAVDPMQYF
ncbi:MAG: peptidoglycan DD-metalloendopeptidase family protein [Clostridia bacterium]|nr:peptidoglycan DD-metalloendopeptidase family protein [Clostridia bacterium]